MTTTTTTAARRRGLRCELCTTPLIPSARSCPGCGMRPGQLHNNGLCMGCQHPGGAR